MEIILSTCDPPVTFSYFSNGDKCSEWIYFVGPFVFDRLIFRLQKA